jgi:hypothetical protein
VTTKTVTVSTGSARGEGTWMGGERLGDGGEDLEEEKER